MVEKFRIKLLPIVLEDLENALDWYSHKEDLLNSFKSEIKKEIDYIANHPYHYQIKYKNIRQAIPNRFPFAIFYSVFEEQQIIVIFGILHTKRNPKILKDRI